MKEQTRNLLVGLTVLAGLAMLVGMIFLFAGQPTFFQGGYRIRMIFLSTAEAKKGDSVHLAGIRIGEIASIEFADNDPRKGVVMVARIDPHVRIPADIEAFIYSQGLTGGAYVELKSGDVKRLDPKTGQPLEFLPAGYDQPIQGYIKSGLVPDELKDAMSGVAKLADNLNKLLAPPETPPAAPSATAPATRASTAPARPAAGQASLHATIARLNAALEGMDAVFGDPQNQKNLKTALANLAKATDQASDAMTALKQFAAEATKTATGSQKVVAAATTTIAQAGQDIDRISQKLIDDADRLGLFLTTLNNVALKLEKGQGSAGKLLNDPGLYNSLVDTARELDGLLKDLRGLAAQWKEKGIPLKLK